MQITGGMKFRGGIRVSPPAPAPAPVMPNIGSTWTYQTGLSSLTEWSTITTGFDVAWDGSKFLVAGGSGRLATSPDGVSFTYQGGLAATTFSTSSVNVVNWNGSQFIVGGIGGRIATSPDGITWTYRGGLASGTWSTNTVLDIHWNGSQYLAVGSAGACATSPDGINWTYRSGLASVFSGQVNAIAWDGSRYVVVGNNARNAYSTNGGVNWTSGYTALTGTAWATSTIYDIDYGNGTFVIGGAGGKSATTTDGATWTYQSGFYLGFGPIAVYTMYWTGSQFFAGGEGGAVAVSSDGVNWSFYNTLQATAWGGSGIIYGARANGTSKLLVTGQFGKAATSTS